MKTSDVEAWARRICDRVRDGHWVEDAQVELKAKWGDPKNWAQRIGGHANAARGEPILWLVGVDETKGVVGANACDFAQWWAQAEACFDDVAPTPQDLALSVDDLPVFAIVFDSSRAPFVIKGDGGKPQYWVPWRQATAVRAAQRHELLRIVVPASKAPRVDVLDASLKFGNVTGIPRAGWYLDATFYVAARSTARVILPCHLMAATLQGALGERHNAGLVWAGRRGLHGREQSRDDHVVIEGAGKMQIIAGWGGDVSALDNALAPRVQVSFTMVGEDDLAVTREFELPTREATTPPRFSL